MIYRNEMFAIVAAIGLLAETKISLEKLPPAVRAAAQEHAKGATIVGLSQETEKGHKVYEVETRLNGKSRDMSFDGSGKLLEIEEEVSLESLPQAARDALQKRAQGAPIKKVELVTVGSSVSYEAAVTKGGRNSEIGVNPDGSPHKD